MRLFSTLQSTRRPWTSVAVDTAAWRQEASEIGKYLDSYGARLPAAMREELTRLSERLTRAG
jgi:GTP-dependent phosphoenolpyruvate carboxykinase